MSTLQYVTDLIRLFFPHLCPGCGDDLQRGEKWLCLHCFRRLPYTRFHERQEDPVEKMFWGRIPVSAATAGFYFSKGSLMQTLIHACKYHDRKDIALQLGVLLGKILQEDGRFREAEVAVPVPLFAAKEKQRGYNQSALLAEGIASVLHIPCAADALARTRYTDTQTHKSRPERWQNVSEVFHVKNTGRLADKHILLVDDVLTTGATLEACGTALLEIPGTALSIAALACTDPL